MNHYNPSNVAPLTLGNTRPLKKAEENIKYIYTHHKQLHTCSIVEIFQRKNSTRSALI